MSNYYVLFVSRRPMKENSWHLRYIIPVESKFFRDGSNQTIVFEEIYHPRQRKQMMFIVYRLLVGDEKKKRKGQCFPTITKYQFNLTLTISSHTKCQKVSTSYHRANEMTLAWSFCCEVEISFPIISLHERFYRIISDV